MNRLIFRTPPGNAIVETGTSLNLGIVDTSKCERIRVVAVQGNGSSDVRIRLTIVDGNELVADLDQLYLATSSSITRVYEVPGVKLKVNIDALGVRGQGQDGVIILIYGWEENVPAETLHLGAAKKFQKT